MLLAADDGSDGDGGTASLLEEALGRRNTAFQGDWVRGASWAAGLNMGTMARGGGYDHDVGYTQQIQFLM